MLADFPWQRFSRFIDVGGATGSFLAALLRRHPASRGVLFDLPQVGFANVAQPVAAHLQCPLRICEFAMWGCQDVG